MRADITTFGEDDIILARRDYGRQKGGYMTKKDYIAVAKAIRGVIQESEEAAANSLDFLYAIDRVVEALSNTFRADNERFSRAKFLKACGLGEGE